MKNQVQKHNDIERETMYITPVTDIYEDETKFVLLAELPGATKDGMDITIENNTLEIVAKANTEDYSNDAEGAYDYAYKRVFRVNKEIDAANISAALKNGILTLELAKSESLKPRKIEIATH